MEGNDLVILTAEEILKLGCKYAGIGERRYAKCKKEKSRIKWFKSAFGSDPITIAEIFDDLQTTDIAEAFIDPKEITIDHLLMAMNFLYRYTTELQRAGMFGVSPHTAGTKTWLYVRKIQALKEKMIVWPEDHEWGEDIFIITVDGTHFRIHEPTHPTKSQDKSYYSFKYKSSGCSYEIGIRVHDGKCVWLNGPFKSSMHDFNIFKNHGLRDKIPNGKRVIADSGYGGLPEVISTPNSFDSVEVAKMKSRARCRHETFNGRLKNFGCLRLGFRHDLEKLGPCIEAVAVVVSYQIENGHPLYEV